MPVNCIYPQNGPLKQCHRTYNIFESSFLSLIPHELAEYFYVGFRWISAELTEIPGILWKHPKTANFWSAPSVLQLAVSRCIDALAFIIYSGLAWTARSLTGHIRADNGWPVDTLCTCNFTATTGWFCSLLPFSTQLKLFEGWKLDFNIQHSAQNFFVCKW